MKISIDDQELFTLTDIQKQVICDCIHSDEFDADMQRRLNWVLMHKYERCYKRLKDEWDVKLQGRVDSVPTNCDKYCSLVFSQPDYIDRKQRDEASKEKNG